MERIQKSSLLNGWLQNQLMTAFTPSRVMCKSIILREGKAFSLTLRRTHSVYHRVDTPEFAKHERSVELELLEGGEEALKALESLKS